MNNEEQYDFFAIGQRHARDSFVELRKIAESYEKNYGPQARADFELGIASVFPQYSNFSIGSDDENIKTDGATTNFGIPNSRNNSYFGGAGTSRQFIEVNGKKEYNNPDKKSIKKH